MTGTLGHFDGTTGSRVGANLLGRDQSDHGLFDASRFVLFYFHGPPREADNLACSGFAALNKQTGLSAVTRLLSLIFSDSTRRGSNR